MEIKIGTKFRINRENIFSEAINITLIIYAFFLPFSNAFSTFTGPYILTILWILEGNWERKVKKIEEYRAIHFLILFLIINVVSLFWSSDVREGIHNIKYYFAILSLFVVTFTSLQKRYLRAILLTFLLSMFISELILYGVYLDLWSIKKGTPSNPSSFMHHVLYSIFLASTILLLIWQILENRFSIKVRVLETIFLLSTFTNLFLNVGRTGQVGFVMASIIFTVNYFRGKLRYVLYLSALLIAIFFTAYHLSEPFYNRVHQGFSNIESMKDGNFNSSWGARVLMKERGIEVIKLSPIFGFGVGDDRGVIRDFLNRDSMLRENPILRNIPHIHDQLLQIAIQTGVLGVVTFLLFIFFIFKENYQNHLTKSILFSVLTLYITAFFIDVPLRNYTSGLFGFLLGLLVYSSKPISR
jgi:O-antigen ligase